MSISYSAKDIYVNIVLSQRDISVTIPFSSNLHIINTEIGPVYYSGYNILTQYLPRWEPHSFPPQGV